jgi:hypothetical protein
VQARINGFSDDRKDYCIRLIPSEQEHAPNSPLLRLALDRKLLEIVSLYLGMWPRLNLISAWLSPVPEASDTIGSDLKKIGDRIRRLHDEDAGAASQRGRALRD